MTHHTGHIGVASFTYACQVFRFQLPTGNSPTWLQPIVQLNNLAFFHLSQLKRDYWERFFQGLFLLNTRFSINTIIYPFNSTFLYCRVLCLSGSSLSHMHMHTHTHSHTRTKPWGFYPKSACVSLSFFSHVDGSLIHLLFRKTNKQNQPFISLINLNLYTLIPLTWKSNSYKHLAKICDWLPSADFTEKLVCFLVVLRSVFSDISDHNL